MIRAIKVEGAGGKEAVWGPGVKGVRGVSKGASRELYNVATMHSS